MEDRREREGKAGKEIEEKGRGGGKEQNGRNEKSFR